MVRLGVPDATFVEQRGAFMRYRGQGHEFMVKFPVKPLEANDGGAMSDWFGDAYKSLFGCTIPNLEVEVLTWTLSLSTDRSSLETIVGQGGYHATEIVGQRNVFDPATSTWVSANVFSRNNLQPGAQIAGPALLVEDETTTLVANGFNATINRRDQIVMTREMVAK